VTPAVDGRGRAAAAAPAPDRAQRNQALDFTKGSLVLIMVFYHWFNYFVSVQSEWYRYLRFLTPSFIFITGFLVSHVYLAKYLAGDSRVSRRLLERGGKVLLLFTALNIGASLVVRQNYNGAEMGLDAFVGNAYGVYVVGNGRAVFDVLVLICNCLLFAPVLLVASSRFSFSLHAAAVASLLTAFVASARGVTSANVEMLAMAVLGMAVGTLPFSRINEALRRPALILFAYALYLAAITLWNVRFPLQVVGVCLSLLLIYLAGVRAGHDGVLQSRIIELGQYSLFAYIIQVALLQVLRRGLRDFDLHGAQLLMPLAASLVLTAAAVEMVSFARVRLAAVDRVYRAVFA